MSVLVGFVVEMTEHERGWGQRPDGFLVFETEAKAKSYVQKEIANRTKSDPDDYVVYHLRGYMEVCLEIISRIISREFIYVDRISELMAYDTGKYK
jgi:hypothetical protein